MNNDVSGVYLFILKYGVKLIGETSTYDDNVIFVRKGQSLYYILSPPGKKR